MDFQLTRKPRPSWLCQGFPGFCSNCSLELKVRSIRLVGIVLSMFCLIERVPYLRFDYFLGIQTSYYPTSGVWRHNTQD